MAATSSDGTAASFSTHAGGQRGGERVGKASLYVSDYLGEKTHEYEVWCRALANQNAFRRYELAPFGNFFTVGPKIEWYLCNADGWRAKYKWKQTPRFLQAGYLMSEQPLLMQLVQRIEDEFGEKVNQYAST